MLDAARLNERQLMPVIKDVGMARGRDVPKLDWLWKWLNKQTGVKLNVFHCNAYISQLARRERWSDAVELCASMPKPDVVTYNSVITACEKSGQWEAAEQVLKEMKAVGVQPDVITHSALISAYEKGGQWERAKATFEEMKAAGMKPTVITYSALISAYEMSNQWARARATFEEMQAAGCSLTSRRASRSSLSSDNASPYSRHG